MRIAILSDIHDNLWNLEPAVEFTSDCDALVCCGDLCSPFVVDVLKKFPRDIHMVTGNNDADLFRITRKCDARAQLHGELAELEFAGIRVAVQHFDFIARGLAHSGLYDVVCYGHNHRFRIARVGRTLAINPGPVMGVAFGASGWEPVPATFVTYDTAAGTLQAHAIREGRVENYPFDEQSSW